MKSINLRNQSTFGLSDFDLRFIALGAMLIDHIGLYLDNQFLRVVGRISYPLFLWLLILGFEDTRNSVKYSNRLFLWGLASQLLLWPTGLFSLKLNIFFSLGLASLVLRGYSWAIVFFPFCDYSLFSPFALWSLKIYRHNFRLWFLPVLAFVLGSSFLDGLQFFSVLSLPLIFLYSGRSSARLAPPWLPYAFYPVHLLVLWAFYAN